MNPKTGALDSNLLLQAEDLSGDKRLKPDQDKLNIQNKEAVALSELKEETMKFQETMQFLQSGLAGQEGIFDWVEPSVAGMTAVESAQYFPSCQN